MLALCSLPLLVNGLLYIDNAVVDSNEAFGHVFVAYTHDKKGNAVTNVTFVTNVTATKLLLYIKINIAEDQKAAGFKREVVNTVVDAEKVLKGNQL